MRLVHLSDLHLGFRAFSTVERGMNVREADVARAFRAAIRDIVRIRPDLILVTGDVFDHPDPPSSALLTLFRGLRIIGARLPRTPVLVIAGERDTPRNPAVPGPIAVLDALPGVEAAASAPRAVRFAETGVHALLVPHRAAIEPPHPRVRPDPEARWNLLLVRGDVDLGDGGAADTSSNGVTGGAAERGRPEAAGLAIDPTEWDYVAVGGPHRSRTWAPNLRSPGSLERPGRDPWSFAMEERGFLVVDLGTGESELHPIVGRPVVDLAPVRVDPGDPVAGTRRFRDLLEGVPGGVDGKLVRARFEGEALAPGDGVSPALLAAVRRRAAHLEVRLSGRRSATPGRPGRPGPGTRPSAIQVEDGSDTERETHVLPDGVVIVTAATESLRARVARALRGGSAPLRFSSPFPSDPDLVWAGAGDLPTLLQALAGDDDAGADGSVAPASPNGAGRLDGLDELEGALRDLRADAVEASGDLEVKTLEWARERQDAESHLHAYRSRAVELRRRIRAMEEEGRSAECPTCGRPMGDDLPDLLTSLREEWDSLVQDGRWWARRRTQLEEKPDDLIRMEEAALRLHARVEEAGEEIERLRERARHQGLPSRRGPDDADAPPELSGGPTSGEGRALMSGPGARKWLRSAAGFLADLTDGRLEGFRPAGGAIHVVASDGRQGPAEGGDAAMVMAALRIALWAGARERRTSEVPAAGLLLWELAADGASDAAARAVETLAPLLGTGDVAVVVAPPDVTERVPEAYRVALEVVESDAGRMSIRRYVSGVPRLTIRSD